MFLLFGASDDPCLNAVTRALAAPSRDALIVGHPFMGPAVTAWRFDSLGSDSVVTIGGERIAIDGVLAARRAIPSLDPSELWSRDDQLYNHAEAEAALLGWLWGLPCTVIDLPPAWLWYRTRRPVLAWAPLLKQAGLAPLDSVISGDASEIARFLQRQSGAAFESSIVGGLRHIVEESDAVRISDNAAMAPVRLTELHHGAWRACIAGAHLVWDDGTPSETHVISTKLHDFAARLNSCFVEFVVTAGNTSKIVDVEPRPRFELFGARAQSAIAEALAETLAQRSGLPVCIDAPLWTSI